MSSLARQLQGIASLDADRITSAYGAPSGKSYLFPPDVASGHDIDSIFALAQSGFDELLEIDPEMEQYERDLFSEGAKRTDRLMLSKEENDVLDEALEGCLRRLGRWIGVMAAGKCLEWLVRRFRVHEMNAETVLRVFLPYHESQNFPRILAILTLPTTSPYHVPFAPLIKNAQAIPRSYIVTAISPAKDKSLHLLGDLISSVQQAVKEGVVHRALLTFWSATLVDLLEGAKRAQGVNEAVVRLLVEAFVTLLETPKAGEDVNAAIYPPLVLLTRAEHLADEPFAAILSSLLTPATGANASQRMLTLLLILNDRSNWALGLGPQASENLVKVRHLDQILVAAMDKYGFENALKVLLASLLEKPDLHVKTLAAVLEHKALPDSLAELASNELLQLGSNTIDDSVKATCKSLLSNLRQRHPTIVDSAFLSASSSLAISSQPIDHDLVQKPSDEVAFLDVYAADVSNRIEGVKAVFEMAKKGEDVESIISAFEARLSDGEEEVIKTLYEDAEGLLSIMPIERYIAGVKVAFWAAQPNPKLIGLHLDFVSKHLIRAHPESGKIVYESLLFPVFLSTESRQPLTKTEALKLFDGGFKGLEKLGKISSEIVNAREEGVKGAQKSNLVIAKALAEATYASATFAHDVAFLVSQLASPLSAARLLAYMILQTLIVTFRGPRQLSTASAVLVNHAPRLAGHSLRDIKHASEHVGTEYLEGVYKRPEEGRTTLRAVVSILASASKIVKPEEQIIWLASESKDKEPIYKSLAYQIYLWANTAVLPAPIAQSLLRSLLTQLGEDALLFFASVWTSPSALFPSGLRTSALRHALAFIRAYAALPATPSNPPVDFQVILPQVLIALQDSERQVRQAAVDVLKGISGGEAMGDVYALDVVYGERSESAQLLKPVDRKKYIETLLEVADEFIIDPLRIRAFHTEVLNMQQHKNRKESAHRRAVLGFLMSHIAAYRSIHPRLALLALLADVHDTSILRSAVPLLEELANDKTEEAAWLSSVAESSRNEYLQVLSGSLRVQSVAVLAENNSEGWAFFMGLLDTAQTDRFRKQLRELSLQAMVHGVFSALTTSQKIDYITALIQCIHSLPTEESHETIKVLEQLELTPDALIELIGHLSDPLETSQNRKRQRQDGSEDDRPTQAVLELTTLIDSRTWPSVPASAPLIASLMSILSALLAKRLVIKEGIDYLEQEVLFAILSLVERVDDAQEIHRAHVGIEVIIKVVRASTNPRTSQRALLVASELARLIPEAVLHNVMPIFTFMGASDFQRDDAYTFGVVEKTVSRIVPVMTASLKEKAQTSLELYTESLTFLSIFTDMAGRLPRHRTLPFFVHLVKSLGASDYLAPVSMLLVDRATTKAGRNKEPVSVVLDLPSSVASAFGVTEKVVVLQEVVQELGRLVGDLSRTDKEAFLSETLTETDASDRSLRQITHLLTFLSSLIAQLRGKACDQALIKASVRQLIVLAASMAQPVMASTDIPSSMHSALAGTMLLLSVDNFLAVTAGLLAEGTEQDIVMSLGLFTERLPLIKSEVRLRSTQSIAAIVKKSAAMLATPGLTVGPALDAIKAVVKTAVPQEDGALAGAVLPVVGCAKKAKDNWTVVSALSLVELLVRHLASRAIPYVQSILDTTLALIKSPKSAASSVAQAFTTLASTIETIPTFISSKQLIATLITTFFYRSTNEATAYAMLTTLAKKIRTKAIFPVLMEVWKTTQETGGDSEMKGFFEMLRLTLKNASREDLPSMLKPVFAFFLDVFDLRHRLEQKNVDLSMVNDVEESAIGSFLELVTKLNEATFKPLFVRLYDWAVIDLAEGKTVDLDRLNERKIVLFHVMTGLLNKFKNLLSPYMATLLPHIHELLPAFSSGANTSLPLWNLLLGTLAKSFEVDEGAFWTDVSQIELLPLLVSQVPLFLQSAGSPEEPRAISNCLASLAGSTTSETVLRRLNTSTCLVTRSDDPKIRLAALDALSGIWEAQAEEMVGLVPETVSEFLAELLEDESKDVEIAARNVLAKIEKVTGSLKEYLE
ncbi:U3 small nucleolar RNA-associated protein 10 [Cryptococcus floricola]|uniref:U3 small nucleolar RNA-associated protein 10 n=1 Tax=Cryptococcus floricola TaxID=2591691 RepID=A0A5D3B6Z9_9TREE|nr:U3 small nucleolar RNA-associated protein 10 [Cryptococcus floricola]